MKERKPGVIQRCRTLVPRESCGTRQLNNLGRGIWKKWEWRNQALLASMSNGQDKQE